MAFDKIDSIIKTKNVKPADSKFHTLRTISNEKGQPTGKIRILVLKDEPNLAHAEMICTECKKDSYHKLEWNGFKTKTAIGLVVECPHCKNKYKLRKMNEEVKRATKASVKEE